MGRIKMTKIKELIEKLKPREFWVERKSFSSHCLAAWDEKPDRVTFKVAKEVVHVVEKQHADLLEACLIEAVESLEYYKQFANLPNEIQLSERIGGGKAFHTLVSIADRLKKGK